METPILKKDRPPRRVRFEPQRLFQHFADEGSKAGGFLFRVEFAENGSQFRVAFEDSLEPVIQERLVDSRIQTHALSGRHFPLQGLGLGFLRADEMGFIPGAP